MSCSARIPVYTLMIAAFVPAILVGGVLSLQGLVFGAMYLLGILVAIPVAMVLKKTILRGPTPPFVMELPPYRVPSVRSVLLRVFQATSEFVRNAGTIILAMSIVVWALGYFPRAQAIGERFDAERAVAEATLGGDALDREMRGIESREAGAYLRDSFLGRAGRWVEPVVRPLGWDWKIGMATIASFPAREVVVSTLGVIYDLGEDEGGETGSAALIDRLQSARWPDGRKVFTLPVALSIMVFFALCCQCGATVATIRRETNGWRWAGFVFAYMTVLAYVCAFVTFRTGSGLLN